MTKMQTAYKLSRKLTDEDLPSVSRLTSIYGIFLARIAPPLDELRIEFDAAKDELIAAERHVVEVQARVRRLHVALATARDS